MRVYTRPQAGPTCSKSLPVSRAGPKFLENCKGDTVDSQGTSCVSLQVTTWYLQQSRRDLKISKNSKGQCRPSFRQSGPNFALPLEDYYEFNKRTAISMLARSGSLSLKCMVESENNQSYEKPAPPINSQVQAVPLSGNFIISFAHLCLFNA